MAPSTVAALPAAWRDRAELLRRHGASEAACTAEVLATELEAALGAGEDELLKLRDAARASGYSDDYLHRLIQRGALTDYGRPHAPRVRRSELPVKPGHLAPDAPETHTIGAQGRIARAIAHSRIGE